MAGPRTNSKIQQAAFLEAYAAMGNISKACKKAKLSRQTYYGWMKTNKAFREKVEALQPLVLGLLEDEAVRRAVNGVLKPVYYKGAKVGTIREYSDTLLIVLLKGNAPEKYRERSSVDLSGKLTTAVIETTLDID